MIVVNQIKYYLKILLYDVLLGLIYRLKKKIKMKKTSSKLRNNYFLIANS